MRDTITIKTTSHFYFVRHGQTDWNNEYRTMGQTDIPLNHIGLEQAQAVVQNLKDLPITTIFSSPLQRAKKTADIINLVLQKPIVIVDEFKEASLGVMEGKHKGDSQWICDWRQGALIEGGEPFSHFVERVACGLRHALQEQGPILIVAHGGVYRAIQQLFQLPVPNIAVDNCKILVYYPPMHSTNAWSVKEL